jgi:uncharacterized protein (TIGR03086 family)
MAATGAAGALEALEPVYANAERIVRGVTPAQLDAATPCPRYDVREVANHLVSVFEMFSAALEGEERPLADFEGDFLGSDPGDAFARASARNLAGWRRPGALDATLPLAFGPTPGHVGVFLNLGDSLLHGWDVAVATGQDPALPPDAAELMLGFMQGMMRPEMRAEGPDATFGPEVPVPADAPPAERLVAFSGRDPAWRP